VRNQFYALDAGERHLAQKRGGGVEG